MSQIWCLSQFSYSNIQRTKASSKMISFPCYYHSMRTLSTKQSAFFKQEVLIKYRCKVPRLEVILSLNVIECFTHADSANCFPLSLLQKKATFPNLYIHIYLRPSISTLAILGGCKETELVRCGCQNLQLPGIACSVCGLGA